MGVPKLLVYMALISKYLLPQTILMGVHSAILNQTVLEISILHF